MRKSIVLDLITKKNNTVSTFYRTGIALQKMGKVLDFVDKKIKRNAKDTKNQHKQVDKSVTSTKTGIRGLYGAFGSVLRRHRSWLRMWKQTEKSAGTIKERLKGKGKESAALIGGAITGGLSLAGAGKAVQASASFDYKKAELKGLLSGIKDKKEKEDRVEDMSFEAKSIAAKTLVNEDQALGMMLNIQRSGELSSGVIKSITQPLIQAITNENADPETFTTKILDAFNVARGSFKDKDIIKKEDGAIDDDKTYIHQFKKFIDMGAFQSSKSNTNFTQLLESFPKAGRILKDSGMGVDDAFSIAGLQADASRKGAEGGVGFSSMLAHFTKSLSEMDQREAKKAFGYNSSDAPTHSPVELIGGLKQFFETELPKRVVAKTGQPIESKASQDMLRNEKILHAQRFMGIESLDTLNNMLTGHAKLLKLKEEYNKEAYRGVTNEMAIEKDLSFMGQLKSIGSAASGVLSGIGDSLTKNSVVFETLKSFRENLQLLTRAFQLFFAKKKQFESFFNNPNIKKAEKDQIKNLMGFVKGFSDAIGSIVGFFKWLWDIANSTFNFIADIINLDKPSESFGKFIGIAGSLILIITPLAAAFFLILAPLGLISLKVILISALILGLISLAYVFRDSLGEACDWISKKFTGLKNTVSDFFSFSKKNKLSDVEVSNNKKEEKENNVLSFPNPTKNLYKVGDLLNDDYLNSKLPSPTMLDSKSSEPKIIREFVKHERKSEIIKEKERKDSVTVKFDNIPQGVTVVRDKPKEGIVNLEVGGGNYFE